MRKLHFFAKLVCMFLAIGSLQSCIKDTCDRSHTYTYYVPVYKTKAAVRANIKSNPAKAIENPGKIFIKGNYIYLNEVDKGVHVIDNSNPSLPKNVAFIDIPGNIDIAVKGNVMYADMYTDLVTLDITDPMQVINKKVIEGVFPYRYWGNGFSADESMVIVDWLPKDTTVHTDCNQGNFPVFLTDVFYSAAGDASSAGNSVSASPLGKGGSMARFSLVGDWLYTVTTTDLNVFSIASPGNPQFSNKVTVSSTNVETIFPFKDKLFIGSARGMFIYSIANPGNPQSEGQFVHMQSCDPVIADDNFAFVTLHSGNLCGSVLDQMEVLDITNINNPALVKTYPFSNPHGLSKDGAWLFLCDGADGLKVLDASDVTNIRLKQHFAGIETYDVIAWNGLALVVAKDGLYQYDYTDINNIHLLSKLSLEK